MRETTEYLNLFKGAIEYKDDPEAFELAQKTSVETAIYIAISNFAKQWCLQYERKPLVLDLCCATGLASWYLSKAIEVEKIILVDCDADAVATAMKTNRKIKRIVPEVTDAVNFQYKHNVDIILMNSAYHHITNDKKIDFLRNAKKLLNSNGIILIGEHFLPEYTDVASFRSSVVTYYSALVEEMIRQNEDNRAINVVRRAALYCWQGYYEYKVSWSVFEKHITEAELMIRDLYNIWSIDSSIDSKTGCCVVKLGC